MQETLMARLQFSWTCRNGHKDAVKYVLDQLDNKNIELKAKANNGKTSI